MTTRVRRAEPGKLNGYFLKTGADGKKDEFLWGSYKDLGHVKRFAPGSINRRTPMRKWKERSQAEIEAEVVDRYGPGDYIYAPTKSRNATRYIVMRLLESKVQ